MNEYLQKSVKSLPKVGEKTASKLEKLGISTIQDLLEYYPRTYCSYGDISTYEDLYAKDKATIYGEIASAPVVIGNRGYKSFLQFQVLMEDGHKVTIRYFNAPYLKSKFFPGDKWYFYGAISKKGKTLYINQPEVMDEKKFQTKSSTLMPVYSLTKGVSKNLLIDLVQYILNEEILYEEFLPTLMREDYFLADLNYAIRQIHFPNNLHEKNIAHQRLVFNEFLLFLLTIHQEKQKKEEINHFRINDEFVLGEMIKSLPYELTDDQKKVLQEIKEDLKKEFGVMNRLLQGDVGSGKTVMAALSMALVVRSGYQAALMAPTEVLASQHFQEFLGFFEEFKEDVGIALLTGSTKAKERKEILSKLERGEIQIIIGTHALLEERVIFDNLGLAVIDEQHRFGVKQRQKLRLKNPNKPPHLLVMSATPIPRTLAVILYGDLDISMLLHKPSNRLPIKNLVLSAGEIKKAYHFMGGKIAQGQQGYIICMMIEENEDISGQSLEEEYQRVRAFFPSEVSIGKLHGRMSSKEKEEIMNAFSNHEIDLLVSTTVVEVGINVPNATCMIIQDAWRFGLSQLHQLRGRIGRGKEQSYCIFVDKDGADKNERLSIIETSNDGFYIAKEDLNQRGGGDLLGVEQSGDMRFHIANIIQDSEELLKAQKVIQEIDKGVYPKTSLKKLYEQLSAYQERKSLEL